MNIQYSVIIILSIIMLIFSILLIIMKIKYDKLLRSYIDKNKEYTHIKNKLSMIEYYYRNFKEGMNPYTVLRDIHNALDEED